MFNKRPARKFIEGIQLFSLVLSIATICIVQTASLFAIIMFMVSDMNKDAGKTADETVIILIEPMYNVDDRQITRIADALLSSGRISGIVIDTTATGLVVDKPSTDQSRLVHSHVREVHYESFFLGTIELQFSNSELVATVKRFLLTMLVVLAAIISVYLVATRFLILKKTRRVFGGLSSGINRIAAGDYSYIIPETGFKDIDEIIALLDQMAQKVEENKAKLVQMNKSLEHRVAERTTELESSLVELKRMQERLIESGKLSALGQLSAGIAHELNTPLGAIISAISSLRTAYNASIVQGVDLLLSLSKDEQDLYRRVVESGIKANSDLDIDLPSRKELRMGVAILEEHAVPNSTELAEYLADMGLLNDMEKLIPYLSVPNNVKILALASEAVVMRRMVEIIQESSNKASTVIEALRSYLTTTVSDRTVIVDVEADIRKVLTLLYNMLKHGVTVKTAFSGLHVFASVDSLSGVWMNLIRNAIQAMNGSGEIYIRTERSGDKGLILIQDNGPGIDPDIQERIFEPFFTTKNSIQGMGLGLDICKRIVESSQGKIWVESEPGKTSFFVSLPVANLG